MNKKFIERIKQSEHNPEEQRELAKELVSSFEINIDEEVSKHMIFMKKCNVSIRKLLMELAEEYGCFDNSDKEHQMEAIGDFNDFFKKMTKRVFEEIGDIAERKTKN